MRDFARTLGFSFLLLCKTSNLFAIEEVNHCERFLGTLVSIFKQLEPKDENDPIIQSVAEKLSSDLSGLGDRPMILIEAGYIELRKLGSVERVQHIRDAGLVLRALRKLNPSLGSRMRLVVYVNDFEVASCTGNVCRIEPTTADRTSFQIDDPLIQRLFDQIGFES